MLPNNSMHRPALRAAADAERWTDGRTMLLLAKGITAATIIASCVSPSIASDHSSFGKWSEPAAGLQGRLVATQRSIAYSDHFILFLELRNSGHFTLTVQADNPFAYTVLLLDHEGNTVETRWGRSDVFYSPSVIQLAPGSYWRFPISQETHDGTINPGPTFKAHVDTVTSVWMLSPGKYRVAAEYSSAGFTSDTTVRADSQAWDGRLSIPPVEVEVRR